MFFYWLLASMVNAAAPADRENVLIGGLALYLIFALATLAVTFGLIALRQQRRLAKQID
jgi:hypothetical protein